VQAAKPREEANRVARHPMPNLFNFLIRQLHDTARCRIPQSFDCFRRARASAIEARARLIDALSNCSGSSSGFTYPESESLWRLNASR